MTALTTEDPAISGDAEGVDVVPQDGDQLGRNRHSPGLVRRAVLESALVVGGCRVGPAAIDLGPGLKQAKDLAQVTGSARQRRRVRDLTQRIAKAA